MVCSLFAFSGIDMKKDIETLIAEERADIILKYDTVGGVHQIQHSEAFRML
jgi:hypothetical protein